VLSAAQGCIRSRAVAQALPSCLRLVRDGEVQALLSKTGSCLTNHFGCFGKVQCFFPSLDF
jgi:hypothetical protein